MYEYGTLKPVKIILRMGLGVKRENNRGDKPNWGIVYVYMEMSQ
jgi:hypothetical protein